MTRSPWASRRLAISSKIVSEHGGIMRAAPNHPYGTVITVSLPVAKG